MLIETTFFYFGRLAIITVSKDTNINVATKMNNGL